MIFNCYFEYTANGKWKRSLLADNEDFSVKIKNDGTVITAELQPKTEVSFSKFLLTAPFGVTAQERVFVNGYQSWTVSREYAPKDMMDDFNPRLLGIKKSLVNPLGIWNAGDLTFHKYPDRYGVFYGFSYGYVRDGDDIRLIASLNERAGYTIITFDTVDSIIGIEKELQGVTYKDNVKLLELAVIEDEYNKAFDRYFEMMKVAKPRMTRKCGYTTWYNYYTNVTEDIVNRDLNAISELDTKIDIFQIDDGYERAVGDWLYTDEKKFPTGMKSVADSIHDKGMLAGLWLAPFGAVKGSYIYKQHRDWFVKNEKGKGFVAGHNWGGFYALDIYNEEVRAHLKNVFDVVLNEWGYDMVKLDFLYACCIVPMHNKTRGEIMCDAIDLLREWCGDKIILGCGCPLAPAFGKVDFMRIGADVALSWDKATFSREDVSTQNTLMNTVFRRSLDGRAWLNDPDVFFLRDSNIQLKPQQREIIAKVNSLCGNLLFVSDDTSTYNAQQRKLFAQTVTSPKAEILSAKLNIHNELCIDYILDDKKDTLCFNIKSGVIKMK